MLCLVGVNIVTHSTDTQLYISFSSPKFEVNMLLLQDTISKVSSWMSSNLLSVNLYFLFAQRVIPTVTQAANSAVLQGVTGRVKSATDLKTAPTPATVSWFTVFVTEETIENDIYITCMHDSAMQSVKLDADFLNK